MIYIKGMDMPVDCLACRISCKNEHYLEDGRPFDCPLEEAKTGDLISRTEAIEAVMAEGRKVYTSEYASAERIIYEADAVEALSMLPSADAVSRKAKCCPIAETCMSIDCPVSSEYIGRPSAEAVQGEWKRVETRTYKGECTNCGFRHIFMDGHDSQYRFCPNCGARMKGGDSE